MHPGYSLEAAVEKVEGELSDKILPVVMTDIKDFIALTLAQENRYG